MIVTKIMEEQQKSNIKQLENCFIRSKVNFRTTGLTIRKLYHQDSQSHQSSKDQAYSSSPQKVSAVPLHNPEQFEHQTCSNFMKTYIEKLKRQRKRQKKKISHSSQKDGNIGCNITAFPSIQHGQQKLLLLQKLNPLSFRANPIQHTPSARTFDNNYLYQIIKDIKEQRGIEDKTFMKKRLSQGLPILQHKQSKTSKQFFGEALDPWHAEAEHPEPPFECYK